MLVFVLISSFSKAIQAAPNLDEQCRVATGISDSVFWKKRSCPIDIQRGVYFRRRELVRNSTGANSFPNFANSAPLHRITLSNIQ